MKRSEHTVQLGRQFAGHKQNEALANAFLDVENGWLRENKVDSKQPTVRDGWNALIRIGQKGKSDYYYAGLETEQAMTKFFQEHGLSQEDSAKDFCEGIRQVLGADKQSHNSQNR